MDSKDMQSTPDIVRETVDLVIRKMRYRKKVRADVHAELEAHFEDALADCRTPQEQQALAEALIKEFGDAKVLAVLIRRAKKRCRPVWAKVLIRTSQVAGLCALYVLLCLSRLMIGSPTIKVNTIAQLNQAVKQGHDDRLNALPDIEKVIALLTPSPKDLWQYPPYQDMNDVQRQAVETYLVENRLALDQLRSSVKKRHYWREYAPVPEGRSGFTAMPTQSLVQNAALSAHLVEQVMAKLPEFRELSFALKRRMQWHCDQGNVDLALADALAIARLGQLITGKGLLIEQMVGVAISSLGNDSVLAVLRDVDVNEPLLVETYDALVRLYARDGSWLDFSAEKAIVDDMIQRGFTDDGRGNGRPLASAVLYLGGSPQEWWKNLLLLDYPDRKQVVDHVNGFYEDLFRWQTITPWDRQGQGHKLSHTDISTMYTEIMKPSLERTGDQVWRLKTRAQATLTVLALKRYQARYGLLPETLKVLVPEGLMKTLPRDFYSDGPLTYQRKSDTDFVLYSWGADLKDSKGVPSTNAKGEFRNYGSRGDWVFWPVHKR